MGSLPRQAVTIGICVLFVFIFAAAGVNWNKDKVKLKDIQVVTLNKGSQTNARRSSPIPQLRCIGGSAYGLYEPEVVQCYNRGSDGYDVQWECKTDMDESYRFGRIQVSCEGYDYPDDEYILKGSCGLEYELELTSAGRARHPGHQGYKNQHWENQKSSGGFGSLFPLIVIGVVIYCIYSCCIAPTRRNAARASASDSPPPPGFRSEFMPGHQSGGSKPSAPPMYNGSEPNGPPPPYPGTQQEHYTGAGARSYSGCGQQQQQAAGGGGFWSGAATGGVLGYLFGNRGAHHRQWEPRNTGWGQSQNTCHNRGQRAGNSWFSSSSSSSSSSPSSGSSRTTSGFGGTSRR